MGKLRELTEAEFTDEVQSGTVVVDFSATWCGPCRMMEPILETLSSEVEGRAKVVKVDVDNSPGLAVRYEITAVPTIIVFRDGQLASRVSGVKDLKSLRRLLEPA